MRFLLQSPAPAAWSGGWQMSDSALVLSDFLEEAGWSGRGEEDGRDCLAKKLVADER